MRGISAPRRLLMTLDAVGGVWRYAMDLASGLRAHGTTTVFACFGPAPSAAQVEEAGAIGELVPVEAPLDWLVHDAAGLAAVPGLILDLAVRHGADLIHLNLPSQAAGLHADVPVVAVSHSCVVTWFQAVRGGPVPDGWRWQQQLNQAGFDLADAIVAPSRSHAALLARCYRGMDGVRVVHNAVRPIAPAPARAPFVIAAGRWWDEGKNARVLDAAAAHSLWPVYMAGSQRGPNGEMQALRNARPLGEVRHAELRELMARASIFVSPSIYEPFGLAPLEAAGSGLPLVLADIPTYRELWDGAALFAPPHDAGEFGRLLVALAVRPALRTEFGERARERARQYTTARQVGAMAAVYAEALAARTPRRLRASA